MYSNSVIHHGFPSRIRPGVPGLRDHYNLLKSFLDMRVEIEDIIAEREKVVHRFTFYPTHRGEFLGIPSTGNWLRLRESISWAMSFAYGSLGEP